MNDVTVDCSLINGLNVNWVIRDGEDTAHRTNEMSKSYSIYDKPSNSDLMSSTCVLYGMLLRRGLVSWILTNPAAKTAVNLLAALSSWWWSQILRNGKFVLKRSSLTWNWASKSLWIYYIDYIAPTKLLAQILRKLLWKGPKGVKVI